MGFFDKFKNKADKSTKKAERNQPKVQPVKQAEPKADLTVGELQQAQSAGKPGDKKETKPAVKKEDTKRAYQVLLRPMITEKGTYLASENKYLFEVATRTNKLEIKKAINAVYGVWPTSVNIVCLAGKKVRHGKVQGRTRDRKKAIVTLKKGESIDVYEGV
ncbi:MAG TPA: 50S ribosomal protein L23 [Patescibacteria group bacterium]|nr:50S ribosomal protein L23 [Patescibacteria group bacterium]